MACLKKFYTLALAEGMTFMRVLHGPALFLNLITGVVSQQLNSPKLKIARFCIHLGTQGSAFYSLLETSQLLYKRRALLVQVCEIEDRSSSAETPGLNTL